MVLQDDLGNDIVPNSWLLSCFGNYATMRFYYIEGYADDGRLKVHEYTWQHEPGAPVFDGPVHLRPARKPQVILRPKTCAVYPRELLEGKFATDITIHG